MVSSAMAEATRRTASVIEKKVWIQASPVIIFHALTEAKDLVRWFCDRASSDPRVGGELTAVWKAGKSGQAGRAIFANVIPNSYVELVWVDDGPSPEVGEKSAHRLSFTIRSRIASSEVLMHDEDPRIPDEETLSILDEGWNGVLRELKDHCERRQRSSRRRSAVSYPRA